MGWCRTASRAAGPLALAAAALLLLVAAPAANSAPVARYSLKDARKTQGAYLGCFDSAALRITFKGAARPGRQCLEHCRSRGMPIYALSRSLQCTCTASVPAPEALLPDDKCEAGGGPGAVPLFYVHADQTKGCRAQRHRLGWDSVDVAYNKQNALFERSGDALTLRMQKAQGTRVASKQKQLYGMVSFKARVSDLPGVITAAYLRSDRHEKNFGPFEEIDIQWVNGPPVREPATIWLNTYQGGTSQGEFTFPPSNYTLTTGRAADGGDDFHTYTVDWQPGHVSWYLDGFLLMRQSNGPTFKSPEKPMYFIASIWTDANRNFQFGGKLDYSKSPFYSTVANLLRVTCEGPAAFNGPTWAYEGPSPAAPAGLESGGVVPSKGSYLGCFNGAAVGLAFSEGVSVTPETAHSACSEHCRARKMPVYSVNRAFKCACTARLPAPEGALPAKACAPGTGGRAASVAAAAAAPLFYLRDEAGGAACSVGRHGLGRDALEPAYNPENAMLDVNSGALTLRMQRDDGVRVASAEKQVYGMVSFKARVSDLPGVITAAYLRSDMHDGDDPEMDEIDLLWINGHPVKDPGTIWLHSYQGGKSQGEHRVTPSAITALTGRSSSVAEEMRTYSIDWQPGHVAWYLDGALLLRKDKGPGFSPPTKPMHFIASIWSDADRLFEFGGKLDYSKSPFYSAISDLVQLECGGKGAAAADADGPEWIPAPVAAESSIGAGFPRMVEEGPAVKLRTVRLSVGSRSGAGGGGGQGPPLDVEGDDARFEDFADVEYDEDGTAPAPPAPAEPAPAPAPAPALEAGAEDGIAGDVPFEDFADVEYDEPPAAPSRSPAPSRPPHRAPAAAPQGGQDPLLSGMGDGDVAFADFADVEYDDEHPPAAGSTASGSSAAGGRVAAAGGEDEPPPGAAEFEPEEEEASPAAAAPAAAAPPLAAQPGGHQPRSPADLQPRPQTAESARAHPGHGAYLGCFDGAVLQLDFSDTVVLTPSTVRKCIDHCRLQRLPVYAVSRALQCLCAAAAPHPAAALPDEACGALDGPAAARAAASATAVPLFYDHSSDGHSCRVVHTKLGPESFEAMSGSGNALFDEAGDALTLRMQGASGAAVAARRPQAFGMVSFAARVSDRPGVVTTVQMRSNRDDSVPAADAIDVSWINGHPAGEPASMWLSANKSGVSQGEFYLPPSLYTQVIGRNSSAAEEFHTYAVDWQPGYVSWYFDNTMLMRQSLGEGSFQPPGAPLYLFAGISTETGKSAVPFGGSLKATEEGPFYSTLSNVLQVLCDQPPGKRAPAWAAPVQAGAGLGAGAVAMGGDPDGMAAGGAFAAVGTLGGAAGGEPQRIRLESGGGGAGGAGRGSGGSRGAAGGGGGSGAAGGRIYMSESQWLASTGTATPTPSLSSRLDAAAAVSAVSPQTPFKLPKLPGVQLPKLKAPELPRLKPLDFSEIPKLPKLPPLPKMPKMGGPVGGMEPIVERQPTVMVPQSAMRGSSQDEVWEWS